MTIIPTLRKRTDMSQGLLEARSPLIDVRIMEIERHQVAGA